MNNAIGYACGTFDLLHKGHISFLANCKKKCSVLLVFVDSDTKVKLRKGIGRPIECESTRINKLKKTGLADAIFLKEDCTIEIYEKIKFNIYFHANDRRINEDLKKHLQNNNVEIVTLQYSYEISTSSLIMDS
ncbi:adenylyltransferase/cytidyltransferase family protein [Deefgea piscis]|uniref:Adenylyltransferase/cytidyltransferase family protein n=1 Tax=Deefgea piscis TaxID=2739061 RepID=A0A6M8SSL4_9NEIS|nr:adenylyltransferase/cytidyltransferase family protein [Deefgea piscis]QKJ66326.1 adenylyltransferase/cytidyltransferase family protein [Deefgea piscis]